MPGGRRTILVVKAFQLFVMRWTDSESFTEDYIEVAAVYLAD